METILERRETRKHGTADGSAAIRNIIEVCTNAVSCNVLLIHYPLINFTLSFSLSRFPSHSPSRCVDVEGIRGGYTSHLAVNVAFTHPPCLTKSEEAGPWTPPRLLRRTLLLVELRG